MSASSDPTLPIEQWSAWLQRRVMRLLLLHDQHLFRGHFRTFYTESALPKLPLFDQYDRYLRLRILSHELLDDILPRIRRRLSLQSTTQRLREEAPTRGGVDWQRTLERGWNETPGLMPLHFHTRLRQSTSATPENLLAVAVLLAYRRHLQSVLRQGLDTEPLNAEEIHILEAADEQAERELAAPFARILVEKAQQGDIPTLISQIQMRLRPGPSPYRDLIAWWHHFSELHIGRAAEVRRMALASQRTDEKVDAWLYELWIALEFVHLLHERRALVPSDTTVGRDLLQFTFTWQGQRYCFAYNRQAESASATGGAWEAGPASRPDYTLEREHPLEVRHQDVIIWREAPLVLDAKFYLSGHDPARTHPPIKKLLGDMLLFGARHGGLFFPLLPPPAEGTHTTRIVRRLPMPDSDESIPTNAQVPRHHAGMLVSPQIALYQVSPSMPPSIVQARLEAILNQLGALLPLREAPACHGIFLDVDTFNVSRDRVPPSRLLCPKPHIGPEVFDIVDSQEDCLRNPYVCHVIGQPIPPPHVFRPFTPAELASQTENLRTSQDTTLRQYEQRQQEDQAELLRNHIFTGVGRAVAQYVKVRGNTAAIEQFFEAWIFGRFWRDPAEPRRLSDETRAMLISGEYVWQEYIQTSSLADWAAPTVQYCRALEHELRRRFCGPKTTEELKAAGWKIGTAGWTLGTPIGAYKEFLTNTTAGGSPPPNWTMMLSIVRNSGANEVDFEAQIRTLVNGGIREKRNDIAHVTAVPQSLAEEARRLIIGQKGTLGALCWFVEYLDPL